MSLIEVLRLPNLTGAKISWPSVDGIATGIIFLARREGSEFVVFLSSMSVMKDNGIDPRKAGYKIVQESYHKKGSEKLRFSVNDSFRTLSDGTVKITGKIGTITIRTIREGVGDREGA